MCASGAETILFVGNSYLYYNDSVHNHVEDLLREHYKDESIHTELIAIGGSRLNYHSIDQILNYEIFDLDKPVNKIIFQGGSSEVQTPRTRKILAMTSRQYSQKAQSLGIETYLYMTHPYQKSDPRYEHNLIEKIKLAYYQAGAQSNSTVIPVGIAFDIAYKTEPSITLHLPDGTHPNMLGTYLASSTVFASHRFAVTGHKQRRDRKRRSSHLEGIPGVGPTRRRELLKHFGGSKEVTKASITDLMRVPNINRTVAEAIHSALYNE